MNRIPDDALVPRQDETLRPKALSKECLGIRVNIEHIVTAWISTNRRINAPKFGIRQHHRGHPLRTHPKPEEVDPGSRRIRLSVKGQMHNRLPVRLRDLPGGRPLADGVGYPPDGGVVPEAEGYHLAVPPCRADPWFLRAGGAHAAKPGVRDQGTRTDSPDVAPGGEDQELLGDPDPQCGIVIEVEDRVGRGFRREDDRADRTADPDPAPWADLLDQVRPARWELVEDEEPITVGLGRRNQDTVLGEETDLPPGERAVKLRVVLAVSVRIEVRETGYRCAARLCYEQAGDEDQEEKQTAGHMIRPKQN